MEWLLNHLSSLSPESVYLTLGALLVLCGLGLPLPEDISLISAGYMAHKGVVNVHTVLVVCFVAVLGGDVLAFLLGRLFGRRILAMRVAHRLFSPRKQRRVRAYFRKFGSKVIFLGRFLPGLRFSIFFSAGSLHVKAPLFIVYDGLAALLSVPLLVYAAYFCGNRIDHVVAWAHRSEYGILGAAAIVATVVAVRVARHKRKLRSCMAEAATAVRPRPLPTRNPAQEN